jgi:superfamily II DNA/RNA helicase
LLQSYGYILLTYGIFCSQLIKLLKPARGRDKGKDTKKMDPDEGCLATGSVIVYVWRQRDAEAVAENLQESGVEGGVVVYHGGMDAGARNRSQSTVSLLTDCSTRFPF